MGGLCGRKMRELRVAKNLTMRELGEQLGVSAPYICELEMGRRNPNEATIRKLCEVLGGDPEEFQKLAQKDLAKVVIQMDSKPDYVHNLAFQLARTIDEDRMDEKVASRIIRILKQEE